MADETGLEFMISHEGAQQLQLNKEWISLMRIYDHQLQLLARSQVVQFLTQNDTFDQLNFRT